MKLERKSFAGEIKQVKTTGEFEAVIATLNVVDKDGDIIIAGAFGNAVIPVQPAHDHRSIPLGKAQMEDRGDKAIADGKFNLDISAGREWHSALKFDLDNPPSVQEWSFGFMPLETEILVRESAMERFNLESSTPGDEFRILKRMDIMEISPVLRGAGEDTGTLSAKSRGLGEKAAPPHESKVRDGVWDVIEQEHKLSSELDGAELSKAFAWFSDGEGALLHHYADDDGQPGDASLRAVKQGIAYLNGSRGVVWLDEELRKGAYEHLAKHLRDAGEEVPDLRTDGGCGSKLIDQLTFATWEAESAVERVRSLREKADRDVGKDSRAELEKLAAQLESALEQVYLLVKTEQPDDVIAQAISTWETVDAKIRGL